MKRLQCIPCGQTGDARLETGSAVRKLLQLSRKEIVILHKEGGCRHGEKGLDSWLVYLERLLWIDGDGDIREESEQALNRKSRTEKEQSFRIEGLRFCTYAPM